MNFTAAYLLNSDDEDDVLDAIDVLIGNDNDGALYVAFSTFETQTFIIVSSDIPLVDVKGVKPISVIQALQEANGFGDSALWFEPQTHSEAKPVIQEFCDKFFESKEHVDDENGATDKKREKTPKNNVFGNTALKALSAVKKLSDGFGETVNYGEGFIADGVEAPNFDHISMPDFDSPQEEDDAPLREKPRQKPGKKTVDNPPQDEPALSETMAKSRERVKRENETVEQLMEEWTF